MTNIVENPTIENPRTYIVKTNGDGNLINIVSSLGEHIPIAEENQHYQQFLEADEFAKTFEVAYEYTFEGKKEVLRMVRNTKLEITDRRALEDYPQTTEERTEWLTYRQALRDLPDTLTKENIDSFEWPKRPDKGIK